MKTTQIRQLQPPQSAGGGNRQERLEDDDWNEQERQVDRNASRIMTGLQQRQERQEDAVDLGQDTGTTLQQ